MADQLDPQARIQAADRQVARRRELLLQMVAGFALCVLGILFTDGWMRDASLFTAGFNLGFCFVRLHRYLDAQLEANQARMDQWKGRCPPGDL